MLCRRCAVRFTRHSEIKQQCRSFFELLEMAENNKIKDYDDENDENMNYGKCFSWFSIHLLFCVMELTR